MEALKLQVCIIVQKYITGVNSLCYFLDAVLESSKKQIILENPWNNLNLTALVDLDSGLNYVKKY